MKSAWAPFQIALYTALTGDSTLMAMIRAVADWPEQDQALPIVTIGDDTMRQYDTKTAGGEEIDANIHIWSKARGWLESKQIADRIITILTANNALTFQSSDYYYPLGGTGRLESPAVTIYEDDGKIRHVILTFNFKLREVT